jgi:CHASE1-domain containing sensor protein
VTTWTSGGGPRSGTPTGRFSVKRLRSALALGRSSVRGRDLFVASIPVTASIFLAAYLFVRGQEAERRLFEQKSQLLRAAMVERLSQPLESITALARFMEVSGSINRQQFRLLAAPMLGRHRSVYAFEWLPFVREEHRAGIEAEARAGGLTDYRIWETAPDGSQREAPARSFYVPIQFMEPPGAGALGFDVSSDPARRAIAEKARDRGEIVASQPFQLVEDTGKDSSPAVALYAPVYVEGDPATVAERRAALTGFVLVIFRVAPLMESAASQADGRDIAYILRDAGAPSSPTLAERPLRWSTLPRRDGFEKKFDYDFVDRKWVLETVPLPGRFEPSWRGPIAAALIGLLTGVIGLTLWVALRLILRLKRQREKVGPYRLVRRLGRGAMGVVWEARHALLRRPTAVKLLAPGTEGERALARFEREVQLTAGLTHPSTIAIYDYGRTADGVFYYAMELLRGINLQQLVSFDGPLVPGRVVHLIRQACGALSEAHAAGLIHRDIKPANLMACIYGGIPDFLKVLDFGLVKAIGAGDGSIPEGGSVDEGDASLSQDGSLLGTPLYMAPEGMSDPTGVDARADIFALGAVGYFLLTGKAPFPGRTAIEVFKLERHGPPIPLAKAAPMAVPESLDAAIGRCLSFDRHGRPASAEELDALLEACVIAPAWTPADARAWWRDRGEAALDATRPGPDERESGQAVFPATASGSHG